MAENWEIYASCMEEIKKRTTILDDAMGAYRTAQNASVPNVELACLQLRKIYELVAFAALSANKEKYSRLRQSFEKDWDIARIARIIENANPDFLPVAIKEVHGEGEHPEIIDVQGLNFTRAKLVERHGRVSTLMHAQNPYRRAPDYRAWHDRVIEWRDEVISVLNLHRVRIDGDKTFYRVAMSTLPNNDVQVAVFELVGPKPI